MAMAMETVMVMGMATAEEQVVTYLHQPVMVPQLVQLDHHLVRTDLQHQGHQVLLMELHQLPHQVIRMDLHLQDHQAHRMVCILIIIFPKYMFSRIRAK